MKLKYKNYPFCVIFEDKISKKTNKKYTSISVGITSKDLDGNYKTDFLNFFDKKDLLVLSSLCENAYMKITDKKNEEKEFLKSSPEDIANKFGGKVEAGNEFIEDEAITYDQVVNDDIPFNESLYKRH